MERAARQEMPIAAKPPTSKRQPSRSDASRPSDDEKATFYADKSVSRSIEFTLQPERVCKRKRCLGLQRECLNLMKRDTL